MPGDVNFDHQAKVVSAGFLHPFEYATLWKHVIFSEGSVYIICNSPARKICLLFASFLLPFFLPSLHPGVTLLILLLK